MGAKGFVDAGGKGSLQCRARPIMPTAHQNTLRNARLWAEAGPSSVRTCTAAGQKSQCTPSCLHGTGDFDDAIKCVER